ncbi:hypothetical protein FD754_024884, partial [Muntiacus muntjak]
GGGSVHSGGGRPGSSGHASKQETPRGCLCAPGRENMQDHLTMEGRPGETPEGLGLWARERSAPCSKAPPSPEHAVTPILTLGILRTVGGGPLVQAQLQLEGVAHAHPHLHPHLAAHAPYLMFPPPPFGLPIASLAESASAAAVVAAAAKSNSKNSSIADLRLKARKHAEALGL